MAYTHLKKRFKLKKSQGKGKEKVLNGKVTLYNSDPCCVENIKIEELFNFCLKNNSKVHPLNFAFFLFSSLASSFG